MPPALRAESLEDRVNPAGGLDPTFGVGGVTFTDFFGRYDRPRAIAMQPDGKILVGGHTSVATVNVDYALCRYNPDGTLDTTFGAGGRVSGDFGGHDSFILDLAVQSDGKIVAAVRASVPNSEVEALRFNPDGSLDSTFSGDGKVGFELPSGAVEVECVAVQADGKIVLAGNSSDRFFACRLNADGSLDTGFGTGGQTWAAVSGDACAYEVFILPDQRIVLAGEEEFGFETYFGVVRLNPDGAIDTTYHDDGISTLYVDSVDQSRLPSAALQPDGMVVIAGSRYAPSSTRSDFVLVRFDADGFPDATFDDDGIVVTSVSPLLSDIPYAIDVAPDGRIVVVGDSSNGEPDEFNVVRYLPNGALDPSFGSGGVVVTDLGRGTNDSPYAVAVQANGDIVVAGQSGSLPEHDFAVVRYLGSDPPNTPPTITDIADRTLTTGQSTGAIPFTVGDAETPAANLNFTLGTSNAALIPLGNVVLGGSGADRTLTVTPAAGQTGTATITITVADAGGMTASDTFVVTVQPPPNTPPTITDIADGTVANGQSTGAVPFTVGDAQTPAASLNFTLGTSNAALVPIGNVVLGGVGASRTVTVTPVAGASGIATITITVADAGGMTASDTFVVTVRPPNSPPTANSDAVTMTEDAAATVVAVLANDTSAPDTGETLTVTAVGPAANGTTSLVGGVVRYTPVANFNGTDTFTYTLSDGNGGTATGSLTVTVTPANDPPSAAADALTVSEDAGATVVDVTANDSSAPDGGEVLTVTSFTPPAHGAVTLVGGVIRYAPATNYSGADGFTYTVSDGNGGTAVGAVTVTVTPVNDPPTAAPDSYRVDAGAAPATLPVLANDSSAPDGGEALSVVAVSPPASGGSVAIAPGGGGIVFTPAPGFVGTSTFTYVIDDGTAGSTATAAVTVVVSPPGDGGNPPARPGGLLVTGPGGGSGLRYTASGGRFITPQTVAFFPGFGGEVHVAQGDVDGDGVADVVAATGPGAGVVRVLRGTDGAELASIAPFPGYAGGVYVTTGDLNGDGRADIVVTPDAVDAFSGPVPDQLPVRVYSGAGFGLLAVFDGLASLGGLSGQGNPMVKLGGRASVADVNGDGRPDLLVAAGNGGGPRITIWGGTGFADAGGGKPTTNPIANLFVFESSQRGGAFVTAGDVDGDRFAELIVGGGPGGGPRLRVVNGRQLFTPAVVPNLEGVNLDDPTNLANGLVLNNFFSGNASNRGGVRVTVRDVDADGRADVVTGSGTDEPASVRVYLATALAAVAGSSSEPGVLQVLDPFGGAALPGGVFVG